MLALTEVILIMEHLQLLSSGRRGFNHKHHSIYTATRIAQIFGFCTQETARNDEMVH
jgi:hypothetical protein